MLTLNKPAKLFRKFISLKREHQRLERDIHGEAKRPYPDSFKLQNLKRKKLAIRDRLAHLRSLMRTERHTSRNPA